MRRGFAIALLALLLLVGVWTLLPAQGVNTITPAILQGRAWIFTALQTFNAGLKIAGSNLQGDTASIDPDDIATGPASSTDQMIARHNGAGGKTLGPDYTPSDPSLTPTVSDAGVITANGGLVSVGSFSANRDLRMADPAGVPTVALLLPDVASCSSVNTYNFYISMRNLSGDTDLSPASADFNPTGLLDLVNVTNTSTDPKQVSQTAWYSSDGGTNIYGCAAGGSVSYAAGNPSVCLCGGTNDTPPGTNTTTTTPILIVDDSGIQRPLFQVLEVCADDCAYTSIQTAIDAAEAISIAGVDSMVLVGPGTYNERLKIGWEAIDSGVGSITLKGYTRDSVVITADGVADTILVAWGKNELRDLTVINTGDSAAIQYNIADIAATNVAHPDSRITNVAVSCPNQTTIINTACIHWETRLQATVLSNLTIRNSLIEYSLTGLYIHDPGHIYTSGNVIRRIRTLVDGPGTIAAVQVNRFIGGTSMLWLSVDDSIEVTRANVADAVVAIDAISYIGTGQFDNVIFDGLSVLVRDLGTSTAGYVSGISMNSASGSTAHVRCFGCDVSVERSNAVGGAVHAVRHAGTSTNILSIFGGHYESKNLIASGVDFLNQGSGVMNIDAHLKEGSHRLTPLAAAPATCSIGDTYADTSGAYCACTATDTWSNMTATGTCV